MTVADVVPMRDAVRRFERWYVVEALKRGGTVTGASRIARVHRATGYRNLHRLGLLSALGLEAAIEAGTREQ